MADEQFQSLRSERLVGQSMGGRQNNELFSSSASAAPPSVNSLGRVVIEDQVTRCLTDYFRCGICFTVLTSDRKPVECNQCRNTLSCQDCIKEWLGGHPSCPYCKQTHPVYEEIGPTLASLL